MTDAERALSAIHSWVAPRVFSLRSLPDGADVSEIAKQYGGGGHKNASGFRLPHGVEP